MTCAYCGRPICPDSEYLMLFGETYCDEHCFMAYLYEEDLEEVEKDQDTWV
jgi:hypothetical protein